MKFVMHRQYKLIFALLLCVPLLAPSRTIFGQDGEEEVEKIHIAKKHADKEEKKNEILDKAIEYPGVNPDKGGVAPLLAKARKSKINVVTWPGFQMLPEGAGSRIFVQLLKGSTVEPIEQPTRISKPPFKTTPHTLVYEFSKSIVMLKNNYNPLVSKYFNTPVTRVKVRKFKKRVYLVIEVRTSVLPLRESFFNYQDDLYFFFIEFEPGDYLKMASSLKSEPVEEEEESKAEPVPEPELEPDTEFEEPELEPDTEFGSEEEIIGPESSE